MPAALLYRLTLASCLCALVGCQSAGTNQWNFWKFGDQSHAARTKGLKDPVRTHLAYAQLQEHSGNLNDARESYQIALEQDAKSVEAVLGLARLDQLAGRDRDADLQFRKALQMSPDNQHVIESVAHFYVAQERFDEAVKLLERGVAADPQNRKMRFNLGVALARTGNMRQAETQFVQAVGDAEADYNLGVILYEKGDIADAEKHFQRAVARKPALVQAQNWLDEIRAEQSSKSLLTSNSSSRFEEISAPTPSLSANTPLPQADAYTNNAMPIVAPSNSAPLVPPSTESTPNLIGQGMLDPSRMSPIQLEQYENSLPPAERERFRQARLGQPPSVLR